MLDTTTFHNYQRHARQTAIYPGQKGLVGIFYTTLGLTNEAGEVAGKVKKIIRDHDGQISPEGREALAAELGDVLWYLANLAEDLGLELAEIAQMNLEKLSDRAAREVLRGNGDLR